MAILLLTIIYIGFISLGLPDGLLGAAWPVMHTDITAPLSTAGIISVIITVGTILSSLLSDHLTRRFGTGVITAVSVAMTAAALFGFSVSGALWQLCLWALPYGLGAGAVDAALNNYVALHYKARHMSWLHCFWGVGAAIGPYIMGAFLAQDNNWPAGYRTVSLIQIALTVGLFLSLPLWKHKKSQSEKVSAASEPSVGLRGALRIRGVKAVLLAFFAYCAAESTVMVWACTYLTQARDIQADTAAVIGSLFYLGMMSGRLISGFLAERLSDKTLIRIGIAITVVGIALLMLPVDSMWLCAAGLLIIGLGCAPVYPCIIHATPIRFGENRSQAIIGIEMAAAYTGSCVIPPVFGLIANHISAAWFPLFITVFFLVLTVMSERLNHSEKENLS